MNQISLVLLYKTQRKSSDICDLRANIATLCGNCLIYGVEIKFKLLYLQKLYELSQKKSFGNVSDHNIEVAVKPFKHV